METALIKQEEHEEHEKKLEKTSMRLNIETEEK